MPAALSLAYAVDTAHGDEAESRAFIESNEMILDDETKEYFDKIIYKSCGRS